MSQITHVRYHVLRDYHGAALAEDPSRLTDEQRRNYVAFTCLLYNPNDDKLYCGITAFDGEILWRFDPQTQHFESLHYSRIAEEFEVKIHRSLTLASDGTLYGASACLYTLDQRLRAPGGAIFRLAPGARQPQKLAIPISHDYIQTICMDEQRGLIYGQTYPVFKFFVYHLQTGEIEDYDFVGSITHISAIDDDGCFWGTWDVTHHYLYKYDPLRREITWYHHGTPAAANEAHIMYPGAGPIDAMINGQDGYLYIGTTGGSLCRLTPKTAEVEYLGHPGPTRRLPGLVVWNDNLLLGAGGDEEGGFVFTYDRRTGTFHRLGSIVDSESQLPLYRVHDLALGKTPDTIYVAETDVPGRSGYLWQCQIEA